MSAADNRPSITPQFLATTLSQNIDRAEMGTVNTSGLNIPGDSYFNALGDSFITIKLGTLPEDIERMRADAQKTKKDSETFSQNMASAFRSQSGDAEMGADISIQTAPTGISFAGIDSKPKLPATPMLKGGQSTEIS